MSKETCFIRTQEDLEKVIDWLSEFVVEKPFSLTFDDTNMRSKAQNSLFHKWCAVLSNHTGYTPDELKMLLKERFLGYIEVTNKRTGEVVKELKHTSQLKVDEFRDFLTEVENISMTYWGVQLPNRTDLYYEAMND